MIDYKIGDCLESMKELDENSVNLAILDPPYYKIVKEDWDNQWKTLQDYIDWLESVLIEVKRVLKDNGSLYIFGDDKTIAYVQVMADHHFNFLNHLVWYKRNNMTIKGAAQFRSYAPVSERILFYCMGNDVCEWDTTGLQKVKLDVNNFVSLRTYFKEFQEALDLTKTEIINLCGQPADHCFRWGSTQWDLPTEETYNELCKLPLKNEFIRKEYEELRKEYEELRKEYEELRKEYEELRRPFNYQKGMYEVFDIPIIGGKENTEHSTTKPKELIKRLIEVSSNEGDLVLDPFLGSGTTLRACRETGRNCIGFEKDQKYESIIKERALMNYPELSNWS